MAIRLRKRWVFMKGSSTRETRTRRLFGGACVVFGAPLLAHDSEKWDWFSKRSCSVEKLDCLRLVPARAWCLSRASSRDCLHSDVRVGVDDQDAIRLVDIAVAG